jgi:hemolysin activation/secretion protein
MLYSPFKRGGAGYLNAIKTEQSNYLSISHRGPMGYRGTAFDLQAARLYANSINAKQQATSLSAGIRHTLIRSLGSNLFISGILEQRSLEDTQRPNRTPQINTDYEVNTLKVTLDGNRAYQRDRLTYRLETTLGDTNLNHSPNRVNDLANANTQGRFNTLSGFLKYRKPLDNSWLIYTEFHGQISNKNLDDSQRLIAGGADALRAFTKAELTVDQGAFIRIDLIKQLNDKWRAGGFIDWANVKKRVKNLSSIGTTLESNNHITAYNWGLTAQYRVNASLRLSSSVAQALSNSNTHTTEQGDVRALLNLNWAF